MWGNPTSLRARLPEGDPKEPAEAIIQEEPLGSVVQ